MSQYIFVILKKKDSNILFKNMDGHQIHLICLCLKIFEGLKVTCKAEVDGDKKKHKDKFYD